MAESNELEKAVHAILSRIDATAYAIATLCDALADTHPDLRADIANSLETTAKADETDLRERPEAFLRLAEMIRGT